MSKVNVNEAVKAANQVREVVLELGQRRRYLEMESSDIERRNAVLLALPLNRLDAKQFILDCIDREASRYMEMDNVKLPFELFAFPLRGLYRASPEALRQRAPLSLADVDAVSKEATPIGKVIGIDENINLFFGGSNNTSPVQQAARFYFFFGDVLKEKIGLLFDRYFPTHGVKAEGMESTVLERRGEIESNELRLSKNRQQIETIDSQLSELGIDIPRSKR